MSTPDFVIIGTLMKDIVPSGLAPGGAVFYAGLTANSLGAKTAALTSASKEVDAAAALPGLEVKQVVSKEDTLTKNVYIGEKCIKTLHSLADPIMASDIPTGWLNAPIIYYGLMTRSDVDADVFDKFEKSDDQIIALSVQGLVRAVGENDEVFYERFENEQDLLGRATVTFVSSEEMLDDRMLADYRNWADILVLTDHRNGCVVYMNGEEHKIGVTYQKPVEPIGAGEVFVAAFLMQFQKNGKDPIDAAKFANLVASYSITKSDMQDRVKEWRNHIDENTDHYSFS